jgi:hypothetical protein
VDTFSFGVSHGPHYRTICHTASFTHWPYETQIQVFEMVFFTGQAPLSWATPVTLPHRRTSPIASASLKITYAFSREPSRRIHIPPCVSRRFLPCFCHSTSIRDLVPRRPGDPPYSKGHRLPTRFCHHHRPLNHSRSIQLLLQLDPSLPCPPSPTPQPSPRSAMVVPLTRSLTMSMKVSTPLWQADVLDRWSRSLTTLYICSECPEIEAVG